jgi:signal peptidase II
MQKYLRAVFIILILFSFISCDQATKSYAMRELPLISSVSYLGGLVRFQFAENQGYFLGIGSTLPDTLRKLAAIIMMTMTVAGLIILLLVSHKMRPSRIIAFSLFLAGSFGNLIDRLFNHGLVVDFIILGTNEIHTGILNIADLLITTSLIMLMVIELRDKLSVRPS